jgi:hypothetical protein
VTMANALMTYEDYVALPGLTVSLAEIFED